MRRSGLAWVAAALVALAAGLWIVVWRTAQTNEAPAVATRPVAAKPAAMQDLTAPSTPMPAASQLATMPASLAVPPGVSAEQWAALRAEYAQQPAELQRLADHFAFADRLDRFRAGRAEGRSAAQVALAQSLDAGLDARLRERELSAGEARLIKIAVLDVLLDDDVQRGEALGRWEASLAAPAPDPARAAAEADFQRRQAAIVAAWRALPAAERDPRALERDLQALRVSSFTPPSANKEGAQR